MSHPTSRVTPGPYLILEVSIEKAVSSFMVFAPLFLASEYKKIRVYPVVTAENQE
jgi:hypothetical protein